jgi:nickel transport protein
MKRLFCLVFLLASAPVHAHDLWVERSSEGLTVYYGHGHSHHEGAELIDYGPEMIVRADCFDGDGNKREARASTETPVRISGGCSAVFVLTSTGYWSKTPLGTKNVSKKEAQSPIRSWLSFESVKRIDGWSDALARPLTMDLEITPLDNPFTLEPGAKIHLLVTFEGKPVEGATVTYDDDPRGITGRDGRANVKLRHAGFQVIQASLTVPVNSEEADEAIHATNLNFETGASR